MRGASPLPTGVEVFSEVRISEVHLSNPNKCYNINWVENKMPASLGFYGGSYFRYFRILEFTVFGGTVCIVL